MEKEVVEIYKELDKETKSKVEKLREETEVRLHEVAEEHQELVIKFAGELTDEEFTVLMKSSDLDTMDKMLILTVYNACQRDK